ncbi:MAG: sensor histidine kinase [Chloroflexota bacterium]
MRSKYVELFKEYLLIYLAGYVTLLTVGLVIFRFSTDGNLFLTAVLLVLFGIIFGSSVYLFDLAPLYTHLYLLIEAIILMLLIGLHPDFMIVIGVLFLPLTSQAPLFLPPIHGFLWVFGYVALAAAGEYLIQGQINFGSIGLSAGGYLGFAGFGATLRRSVQRREESQRLLLELQETHAKLQQYTKQAEQLAVSEERNRLAREMHDSLGHRLTVAIVQLEGAKRLIPTEPDRAALIVDNMRTQIKDALAELRKTLTSLRSQPDHLPETADLKTAVSQLIHTFQSATGLPTHLSIESDLPPLPSTHYTTIYRTVQESLTNIQRHAQADNAWVHIERINGHIQIMTKDDGLGFHGEIEDGRFGLRGLEERASQLGGEFNIQAIEPTGTKLTVRLPLQEVDYG